MLCICSNDSVLYGLRNSFRSILYYLFCRRTAITSLQVAVHLVNVTHLDPAHFSVMSQASVSVIITPLVKSVICVNGDSLVFLMPRVKVRDN